MGEHVVFTLDQIRIATQRVAADVYRDIFHQPAVVLTVMNGGLMFAAELVKNLPLDIEMDYIHATRYSDGLTRNDIRFLAYPNTDLKGKIVLLVDDVWDEGHTLEEIRKWCKSAGATDVRAVVLVNKEHDRKVGPTPEYIGLTCPDWYLFGYGMDLDGTCRNMTSIWRVTE